MNKSTQMCVSLFFLFTRVVKENVILKIPHTKHALFDLKKLQT